MRFVVMKRRALYDSSSFALGCIKRQVSRARRWCIEKATIFIHLEYMSLDYHGQHEPRLKLINAIIEICFSTLDICTYVLKTGKAYVSPPAR